MKKLEKILVAIILLSSAIAMGVMMISKSDEQKNIVITVDNKVIEKISMNNANESSLYDFNFDSDIGSIETRNGRVRMLEMSKEICPKSICSETGWIDNSYKSIVCLPNKIVVTIELDSQEKNEVDMVATESQGKFRLG